MSKHTPEDPTPLESKKPVVRSFIPSRVAISRRTAGHMLGLGVSSIKRMEDRGQLHPMKLPNGHVRFYRDEVEKVLASK